MFLQTQLADIAGTSHRIREELTTTHDAVNMVLQTSVALQEGVSHSVDLQRNLAEKQQEFGTQQSKLQDQVSGISSQSAHISETLQATKMTVDQVKEMEDETLQQVPLFQCSFTRRSSHSSAPKYVFLLEWWFRDHSSPMIFFSCGILSWGLQGSHLVREAAACPALGRKKLEGPG